MRSREKSRSEKWWSAGFRVSYVALFVCMAGGYVEFMKSEELALVGDLRLSQSELRSAAEKLQRDLALEMDPATVPVISRTDAWLELEQALDRQSARLDSVRAGHSSRQRNFSFGSAAALLCVIVCGNRRNRAADRYREREGPVIIGP